MGSFARSAFAIALLFTLAAAPAAASTFSPAVSGQVTDGGGTTSTASPLIEMGLFGETRGVFEFDTSSLPAAAPILSATLSFDVSPTLAESTFSFVVGTYDGDLTLSAGDFSPAFDDASFFSSGSFIGFMHYDLDVSSFLGATVDPSLVPSFNFRTPSTSNTGTVLNASLEVVVVPEPGAAALLASGLVLLGLPRRRAG